MAQSDGNVVRFERCIDHSNNGDGTTDRLRGELPSLVIDAEFYEVSRWTFTLASLAKDFAVGLVICSGGLVIVCAAILISQCFSQ